ncbi:MAG: NAD(P)H-dependent oxidoreductase [Eubacteriales bacterium]|jgi:NAD(P)H-dependent FMN reductase|nr:NAD(P)H-dependent oxidoreductase [Eubacteriales bacterium]MDD3571650.1 NAD(P)H-dependent oxidoreductase [Eubacteriales bacterium]MDD4134635.1 NAD(P)H-dependent oxidoreductase [Eubacteriales bacterium]NLO12681.1 NAD(P)H-dependent oxidoreductase [Clostridiales bacterium]
MLKIAILTGSTRPGRVNGQVAKWVLEEARKRGDAEYTLVDIKDANLPLLDEDLPSGYGRYNQPHTKAWAEVIRPFDGYVMVTPEYNRSTSAALKNALDYLYAEWNNKAVGFVGYGSAMGVRAVQHLRHIVGELQMADVREAVQLSLFTDFTDNGSVFRPDSMHLESLDTMLNQVNAWAGALKTLRGQAQ